MKKIILGIAICFGLVALAGCRDVNPCEEGVCDPDQAIKASVAEEAEDKITTLDDAE